MKHPKAIHMRASLKEETKMGMEYKFSMME